MTHDELLEVINVYNDGKGDSFANALRAVVKLHKPVHFVLKDSEIKETYCDCGIGRLNFYPCPTIQAIEKELG
jgi:hypothetical protein